MLDIGSLSYPSKMPGTSYGLPARECKTGSKLVKVKGSVCHGCYALKGNYVFSNVQKAQYKRLASISDPGWVEAMVDALNKAHFKLRNKPGYGWHRWHDSGDLQSVGHLAKIDEVAWLTPWLKHWLPTREAGIVNYFYGRDSKWVPDNLCIRISATMIDGPPPKGLGLPTSTVRTNEPDTLHYGNKADWPCPAQYQGNKCLDCRACWNKEVQNVSYHKH